MRIRKGREASWDPVSGQELRQGLDESLGLSQFFRSHGLLSLLTQIANPQTPRPPWRLLCVIHTGCPLPQTLCARPCAARQWGHTGDHKSPGPALQDS